VTGIRNRIQVRVPPLVQRGVTDTRLGSRFWPADHYCLSAGMSVRVCWCCTSPVALGIALTSPRARRGKSRRSRSRGRSTPQTPVGMTQRWETRKRNRGAIVAEPSPPTAGAVGRLSREITGEVRRRLPLQFLATSAGSRCAVAFHALASDAVGLWSCCRRFASVAPA
jgi:hypothetical protein